MHFLAIRRDDSFSPNSVVKDLDILQAVCHLVGNRCGVEVPIVDEHEFGATNTHADVFITMGRLPETLDALAEQERRGSKAINSSEGVRNCQRSHLERLMREGCIAMPPQHTVGNNRPTWLKRGDAAAQGKDDVVFCPDDKALAAATARFEERGITDYVTSDHVEGDVVKFYGVGDCFFRCYYPSDDGISKFGDEKINGKAHHYPYDNDTLHKEVVRLATITGVTVYGGDAIIDSDGRFFIIDFNDWPSFSRCKDEAAEAIANIII